MFPSISQYLDQVVVALKEVDTAALEAAAEVLATTYENGGTVFTFGNGACAALASHMACDLGKGTAFDLSTGPSERAGKRLRIVCLNDCVPLMTALANDLAYEDVFLEQLKNLLRAEDAVIGLSGSGGSPNVLRALEYARMLGAATVSMTGAQRKASMIAERSDVCLRAPVELMEQIEDLHVVFHHAIALDLRARIQAKRSVAQAARP